MSEVKRILDMISEGQISSEDGLELINALKESGSVEQEAEVNTSSNNFEGSITSSGAKKQYNFLKVRVISDEDDTKVNVNIPLKLVKSLGGLTSNISSFIPQEAKATMEEKGVSIDNLDINAILNALEEGAMEGPLVDVETEENGKITKVMVYVE